MWLITRVARRSLHCLFLRERARGSVRVVWFWLFVSRPPRDAATVFGVCVASQTKHEPLKDKLKERLCWNFPPAPCVFLIFLNGYHLRLCEFPFVNNERSSARAARVWRCSLVLMVGLGRLITASKWRALHSREAPLKCLRVDLLHRLNSWSCQLSPKWF